MTLLKWINILLCWQNGNVDLDAALTLKQHLEEVMAIPIILN